MKPPFDQRKVEAQDLHRICFHEAAHYTIAELFGVRAHCNIIRCGNPTHEEKAWRGQTGFLNLHHATPYQRAVIGWAGALAEALCEYPVAEWTSQIEEVGENVLENYHFEDASPSPTDREEIALCKQFHRAFNRACALVVLHGDEIREFAEQMIARYSPEITGKTGSND